MFTQEAHSLRAIGKLEAEFPYAATLLVYAVLERCLKLHLLQHRKTLIKMEVELETKVGRNKQKLIDFRNLDDASFIQQFLVNCTLGALEIIYKVQNKKYSDFRNKVFHSELYLNSQLRSEYQVRDRENRENLKIAKGHLVEASEMYFKKRVVELNGSLQFES